MFQVFCSQCRIAWIDVHAAQFDEQNYQVSLLENFKLEMSSAHDLFSPGYVQGMSDLLAPILFVTQNEVESFWCLTGFMELLVSSNHLYVIRSTCKTWSWFGFLSNFKLHTLTLWSFWIVDVFSHRIHFFSSCFCSAAPELWRVSGGHEAAAPPAQHPAESSGPWALWLPGLVSQEHRN